MPLQPNIALQVQGLQLPDPLAQSGRVAQIQNALQQQRMGEMQIQNALREQRRKGELEKILGGFGPEAKAAEISPALVRGGFLTEARTLMQSEAQLEETRRKAQEAEYKGMISQADIVGRVLGAAKDQDSFDFAIKKLSEQGIFTPADVQFLGSTYDPTRVKQILDTTMSQKDRLETALKERTTAAQEAQASAAGTRAQAAVSQATTAADRAAFERANPGFTIQETDKGLFKVNKRTGATEPLMQDGEQLKAPERRPLVQIAPGENAFSSTIGTGLGKEVVSDLATARRAPDIAARANNVLAAIDENKAFVGPASQFKLQLARALNVTGKGPSEQIAATESLIANLKQSVIDAIKASNLGTGNGFTNKDLDFLVQAKAADIANDPKTLAEFARRAYLTAEEAAKLGTTLIETNEQVKRQYQGRSFNMPPMFQSSGKSGVRRGTAAAAEDGGRREIEPGVFVTERP
jgi:hypothetical protein